MSKSDLSTALLKVVVQKNTKSATNHFLLQLEQSWVKRLYFTYKMKKISSNQVLKRTFLNHIFEIDVDCIEKLIYCSLLGGPFGGPACPPVIIIIIIIIIIRRRIIIIIIMIITSIPGEYTYPATH